MCTMPHILLQFWMFFLISSRFRSTQPCCSVMAVRLPLRGESRDHSCRNVCSPSWPGATLFKNRVQLLPLGRQMSPPNLGNGVPGMSSHSQFTEARQQTSAGLTGSSCIAHFQPWQPEAAFASSSCQFCDEQVVPPVVVMGTSPATSTATPKRPEQPRRERGCRVPQSLPSEMGVFRVSPASFACDLLDKV